MLDDLFDILSPVILVLARLLLASLFLMAAASNAADLRGFGDFLQSGGVPRVLAGPVFYFQILAGLALLLGWQTRLAALALAGFTLASGIWFYDDYSDPMQVTCLLKNIALTGGFLGLVAQGAGPVSLDGRM